MNLRFTRLSPDASPPQQINEHDVELRLLGISADGRRRDPLLPAGDARWLQTGFYLLPPVPVFVLATPYDLAKAKLETLHVKNDPNEGLLVCLFSRRLDSIHLAHNTPIALISPLATINFAISIEEIPNGAHGHSSDPAKRPQDDYPRFGDADHRLRSERS